MLALNNLVKLKKSKKRVGRGGDRGGTSGRGHKGQKARSGGSIKAFFEGGQMALSRRLPKRGFTNQFKKIVKVINLSDLETKFSDGETVDVKILREKKLIKGKGKFSIKILGQGSLTKKLVVHADSFSSSAAELIKKAGGEAVAVKKVGGEAVAVEELRSDSADS